MTRTFPSRYLRSLAAAAVFLLPLGASAQTITFNALGGSNQDGFNTYTESGFTVSVFSGSMCVAKMFGNPTPDIFGGSVCNPAETTATIRITRIAGGLFRFLNTDLASSNGVSQYTFAGYLATVGQFSTSIERSASPDFFNYLSSNPNSNIDELRISFSTQGSSYNIDNIALAVGTNTTVPEPSTIVLLGAGLAGLIGASRRRKA